MEGKRYIVHDFLVDSPVLIDRESKTLSLFYHHMHGQLYNLHSPNCYMIGAKQISGITRRGELLQYYKDFLAQQGSASARAAPAQPGGGKIMPKSKAAPQQEAR